MIISRKALPRRTVLRALGATLPLPWLDAMVPALTAVGKSAAAPARRFAAFYAPNGMALPFWYPKVEGALPELPPVLTALTPFKDHVLVVGGLDGEAAKNGSHAAASGTFLSCVPTQVRPGGVVIGATTMD